MKSETARRMTKLILAVMLGTAMFGWRYGKAVAEGDSSHPLLEALKSPNEGVRAKAARELGKTGDINLVPALAEALKDPSTRVRREAILALSGLRSEASVEALVLATKDPDRNVRIVAVQSLVAYYTGQTQTGGFTGLMKKGWERAKSRFVAEDSLLDPGVVAAPQAISALVVAMQDTRSIDAAREAAKGLGNLLARPAVPDLVKAAYSTDKDLALEALDALALIEDRSAGPALLELVDSSNAEIRREAALVVGILRMQEALPKLQSIVETDADPKAREKALEGLAYLGNPVSLPIFIKFLWDQNNSYRASAAEGMGRAGDTNMVSEIERALSIEKDGDTQLAMQYALTSLGKEEYLGSLVEALGSRTRHVIARRYLVELTRQPHFLAKLYAYVNHKDGRVRERICLVLMHTGNEGSLLHLERLSHDRDGAVASAALRAMRAVRLRVSTDRGTNTADAPN